MSARGDYEHRVLEPIFNKDLGEPIRLSDLEEVQRLDHD